MAYQPNGRTQHQQTASSCWKRCMTLDDGVGQRCLHDMMPTKKLLASSREVFPLFEVLWVLEYQYQGIAGGISASGDTTIPLRTVGGN